MAHIDLLGNDISNNPSSGYYRVYFKSDGKPYYRDSDGVETAFSENGNFVTLDTVQTLTAAKEMDLEVSGLFPSGNPQDFLRLSAFGTQYASISYNGGGGLSITGRDIGSGSPQIDLQPNNGVTLYGINNSGGISSINAGNGSAQLFASQELGLNSAKVLAVATDTGSVSRVEIAAVDVNFDSATINHNLTNLDLTGSPTTLLALDSSGKLVDGGSLLTSGLKYQGTWNAASNTPTITSGVGTEGHYYIVSTSGSTNIDGETDWKVGDWIIWSENATAWQKIDNTSFESVTNVGSGEGVFKQVAGGTDVQLKSLVGGSIVGLIGNVSDITIDDSDVASLSTAQTFTGLKEFLGNVITTGSWTVQSNGTEGLKIQDSLGSSVAGFIRSGANMSLYSNAGIISDSTFFDFKTNNVSVTGKAPALADEFTTKTYVDSNFVDKTSAQTITGAKTFSSDLTINGDLLATSNTSQVIGGFGANTTGGVKSWDDVSNARSGSGETLLFTDAINGSLPHSNDYYHPFSFEFNSKDGSGNLTQFAIPYRTQLGKLNYRSKFNGVWQEWAEFLISKPHATERVYNLPTSTNSNPTTGDFWFDGANIRVQGNLETSGDIEVNNSAGGDPFVRLKTAAQEWVMRIDQSNSERFEIRDVTNSVSPISIAPNGSVDVSSLSIDKKIVLQTFNNLSPTLVDIWSDGQEFRTYQRGNQDNTAYDMNVVGASVSLLASQDVNKCPFGFSQVANSTATNLPSGWATSGVSNVITYGHEPNSTTISQVISTGNRIAYRGSRTGTWNEITGGGGGATLLKATIPKADLDTSWSGNTYYTYTKTVTGAEVGDCVNVSFTDQLMAEIAAQNAGIESLQGTVSATDTVKVYVRVTSFITIPTGGDILITVAS